MKLFRVESFRARAYFWEQWNLANLFLCKFSVLSYEYCNLNETMNEADGGDEWQESHAIAEGNAWLSNNLFYITHEHKFNLFYISIAYFFFWKSWSWWKTRKPCHCRRQCMAFEQSLIHHPWAYLFYLFDIPLAYLYYFWRPWSW